MPAQSDPKQPRQIPRRDLRFDFEGADLRAWHPEGLHVSHFFNALSLFFPEGERFFIDSVRRYRTRIDDPALAAEVEDFVAQEAIHSREHRAYNRAIAEAGLPAQELENELGKLLHLARKELPASEQLRITVALEHFTAIMAHLALSEDSVMDGTDARLGAVWRWHAVEETEHKAVAFDVLAQTCGEGWAAYLRRSRTMLATTVTFWTYVFRFHYRLVRADQAHTDLTGWWGLFRFLWLRPGAMRRLALPWLDYFRPGFHPWQHDNREHVERWKEQYEAGATPAAP